MAVLLHLAAWMATGLTRLVRSTRARVRVLTVVVSRLGRRARPPHGAEVTDTRRFAAEVAVAAAQAEDAVQRWRDFGRRAEQDTGDAWQAWQEAEERLARIRAGAAFRVPRGPRTPAEYAGYERFLHRAVTEAVDRGDLPATVLADLAAGEGGWNPRLHPVEQELVLHMAIAAVKRHLYQQAKAAEEEAWRDAEAAAAGRDRLRREADAVILRTADQKSPSREPSREPGPTQRPVLSPVA